MMSFLSVQRTHVAADTQGGCNCALRPQRQQLPSSRAQNAIVCHRTPPYTNLLKAVEERQLNWQTEAYEGDKEDATALYPGNYVFGAGAEYRFKCDITFLA